MPEIGNRTTARDDAPNERRLPSQVTGIAWQTLRWWRGRRQRRQEVSLLCSRHFAGYRRTVRSRIL
jgi:hypothetical protein